MTMINQPELQSLWDYCTTIAVLLIITKLVVAYHQTITFATSISLKAKSYGSGNHIFRRFFLSASPDDCTAIKIKSVY